MTMPSNAPAGAILSRAASLEPATFDVTASTVELVASTGATVRRRDWWTGEEFDEVLVVNSAAVDLTRFEAGSVPILNAHSQWEVRDVLGAALPGSARFESGGLVLTAKLSARDDAAPVIQDIKDGILRNVSVGYRILAYEVDETTKPKTRTITRWELLEVSFVPVGADGLAGTRSLPTTHPTPDNTKEHRMSTPPATSPAPPTDPLAAMRAAEADRIAHIQSRAASAQLGLPSDMITRAITEGWSLDAFNRAVIDHVAAKPSNQRNINPHFQEYDSYDERRGHGVVSLRRSGPVSERRLWICRRQRRPDGHQRNGFQQSGREGPGFHRLRIWRH